MTSSFSLGRIFLMTHVSNWCLFNFASKWHNIWKICQSTCTLSFFNVAIFLSRACSKRKKQMTCISSDLRDWSLVKHSSKKRLTNMITSKYFKYISVQNTQFVLPSPKTRVLWIFKLPSNEQAHSKKASLLSVKTVAASQLGLFSTLASRKSIASCLRFE